MPGIISPATFAICLEAVDDFFTFFVLVRQKGSDDMEEGLLHGVIDMHIHTAPDIRKRRLTDMELMEEATRVGVRAVVIKSHHMPTVDRATLVNEVYRNRGGDPLHFAMFGGIALNESVGGINPHAVEAVLKLGGKVVWLPSSSASNHKNKHGNTGGIDVIVDGRPIPELNDVFLLIKEYDAVLATAHLDTEEIPIVVEAARKAGVNKIVVTHPEFWVVGMKLEDQIKLAKDYNVLFERCYAQPVGGGKYKSNLEDNVIAIKEIGCENIIVSTDGGQMENPVWPSSLNEYIQYLVDHGISKEQIDIMTKKNPGLLLDIWEE